MSNHEKTETDEKTTEVDEQVESTEAKPAVKGKRLKTGVRGGSGNNANWSVGGLSTWSCCND